MDLDLTTRARLEQATTWLRRDEEDPEYIRLGGDIDALLLRYDALRAECDRATPVLAAAEHLIYSNQPLAMSAPALHVALEAWRAARGRR